MRIEVTKCMEMKHLLIEIDGWNVMENISNYKCYYFYIKLLSSYKIG